MKQLLKELGFEQLPMLSTFMDKAKYEDYEHSYEYRNFITQPLTKGMFIPCGLDGEVLKDIKLYLDDSTSLEKDEWVIAKRKEWKQAQERVLFEGCHEYKFCMLTGEPWLVFAKGNQHPLTNYKTIEQAINQGVQLTLK